jgi:hypothetical protein
VSCLSHCVWRHCYFCFQNFSGYLSLFMALPVMLANNVWLSNRRLLIFLHFSIRIIDFQDAGDAIKTEIRRQFRPLRSHILHSYAERCEHTAFCCKCCAKRCVFTLTTTLPVCLLLSPENVCGERLRSKTHVSAT